MKDPYKTPVKESTNSHSNFSSLKERIDSKIKSSKQLKKKEVNFQSAKNEHSYQDTHASMQTAKYQTEVKLQKHANKRIETNNKVKQEDVLLLESCKNPGFYNFQSWTQFNNSHYSHVDQGHVKQLWKILRILNYGEILIPSGLIFEISKVFDYSPQDKQRQQVSLKGTLNNFLQLNRIENTVDCFRQLKFYPPLQQIQQRYVKKVAQNIRKKKMFFKQEQPHEIQNVFDRVYNDAKTRNQTRVEQVSYGLIEKELLSEDNYFHPKINSYYPQKLFIDQEDEDKPQRVCHHKEKWRSKGKEQEEAMYVTKNYRLGQIDESIFQNSVEDVPGAQSHISRQKYSQAFRQRQQRYLQNPTLTCKNK